MEPLTEASAESRTVVQRWCECWAGILGVEKLSSGSADDLARRIDEHIDHLRARLRASGEEHAELVGHLAAVELRLATAEAACRSLIDERDRLVERLNAAEAERDEQGQLKAGLCQRVEVLERAIARLTAELEAASATHDDECSAHAETLRLLRANIDKLTTARHDAFRRGQESMRKRAGSIADARWAARADLIGVSIRSLSILDAEVGDDD